MTHIAIIGGGYSGTLQAIQLLERGAEVTLIERGPRVARGAAYGTSYPEHLLNVRAGGMSAFPDRPGHFADWLEREGAGESATFARRLDYGRYLGELLDSAGERAGTRLHVVTGEAVDIEHEAEGETVRLREGGTIAAAAAILSVGNLEPDLPRGIDPGALGPDIYVPDPWAADITKGLATDDRVLLIGSGLTAIDAALILDAAGFQGRTLAVSRRGLVPRAHPEPSPAVPARDEAPAPRCSALLADVRRRAAAIGWTGAVDQLRPHTQGLWASATPEARRRFLRHLRPWWDVHRHRIAPQIADRIAAMERDGRLRFAAGKILSAVPDGEHAIVSWRPRGGEEAETVRVRRIVNCTGPQSNIERSAEPLLANLLAAGRIRPDVCRIGIDVDDRLRTIDREGKASDSLHAIGPMTRGALWEIVAVPDLRVQVEALARRLA